MTNLCCECVRDAKRMKRDERYFSRYIIEYIVICNTCFKWNSQAAIISRSFSRIDKRKLATRWKSADSILTSVVAHRLNDNEHTFEYPRENLNEHRCSFSFLRIFLLLPFERRKRLSSSLRGSHERLVITRYSRRNWSELLIFFLFLRRDYRHLQLNWSIHQATRTRAFYLIFIADQFSTIRFRCEKDVRTKRGDASNEWKMGKEGEEYRRRQEEIDNGGEVEGKDEDGDRST